MIVPTQIPFAKIPAGGVWSVDMSLFYMKLTTNDSAQLDNGGVLAAGVAPAAAWYFPGAALVLG